jgi:alpha-tubulin suppressor-like RCC1 family protein
MESFGWRSTILLADGRAWSAWPSGDWKLELKSGGFWIGSNWTSVASSYSDDAGIKEDGTLWVSEEPRKPSEFTKVKSPARPLVRVGDDQDWKSVSFNGRKAFLLKRDGTLWSWGENISDRKKEWPGLRAFPPERAGTNSDWTEITQLRNRTVLRKESGETWVVSAPISTKETNSIKLDDKTSLWRAEQWDGLTSVVGVSDQFGSVGNLQVGIDRGGNFLITGAWEQSRRDFELVKRRMLLGKRSDWVSVAGEGETVVALKADGTLWKWKFADDPISNPESASAVRLGKYSDWIAIAEQFGGVTSLAADGSLWFWRSDDLRFSSASAETPLLAASRRPLRIGNIFDAPDVP